MHLMISGYGVSGCVTQTVTFLVSVSLLVIGIFSFVTLDSNESCLGRE